MRTHGRSGFTTIEMLLATVVLAISLIGGSSFFYSNQRNLV
jgi:prepilin-type N-terminal cleavage/methylation domain-containing protein